MNSSRQYYRCLVYHQPFVQCGERISCRVQRFTSFIIITIIIIVVIIIIIIIIIIILKPPFFYFDHSRNFWAYYTSGSASVTPLARVERKMMTGTHFRFLKRETHFRHSRYGTGMTGW